MIPTSTEAITLCNSPLVSCGTELGETTESIAEMVLSIEKSPKYSLVLSKFTFVLKVSMFYFFHFFIFFYQYLNRGCTRYFACKDSDTQIMQNRKSAEVMSKFWVGLLLGVKLFYVKYKAKK